MRITSDLRIAKRCDLSGANLAKSNRFWTCCPVQLKGMDQLDQIVPKTPFERTKNSRNFDRSTGVVNAFR
jgi:hypothetical protein